MGLTTQRESEWSMRPFMSGIFRAVPADSRCLCIWVYAPKVGGRETPWALKFRYRNCILAVNRH